jgi:hypothetical protein
MILHFAYASNMSRGLMRARCPAACPVGPASLDHHRVIVTRAGYASLLRRPGSRVHGLLWRLTPRDLAALNRYEGIDAGHYRVVFRPVLTAQGRVRALVYVARCAAPGCPRPGYMPLVLAAAREAGLPSRYLAVLARLSPGRYAGARAAEAGELA